MKRAGKSIPWKSLAALVLLTAGFAYVVRPGIAEIVAWFIACILAYAVAGMLRVLA